MNAPVRADLDRLAGLGLRIEHRRVDALIPYARNARTHSRGAGGADRRLDPRVRLHFAAARRWRERHHRRARPAAGGAQARARRSAGDRAGAPERGAEAGAGPRRQQARRACWLGHRAAGARSGRACRTRRRPRRPRLRGWRDRRSPPWRPLPIPARRRPGTAGRTGVSPRRSLAVRQAPGALRRRHGCRRRRPAAGRRRAAAHGHRSPVWRRV